MNEKEAKKILAVMLATFPNYNPSDVDAVAKIWADMLSEYSYQQVDKALKSYILSNNSGFAPNIGQLVEKIHTTTTPKGLNEMEAWALVRKALSNGQEAEKEFSKLPKIVQKAVGTPYQLRLWATDENFNEGVISTFFMQTYRTELSRHKEIQKMPTEVRKLVVGLNEKVGIQNKPYIEEKEERPEWKGVPMPDELWEELEDMT